MCLREPTCYARTNKLCFSSALRSARETRAGLEGDRRCTDRCRCPSTGRDVQTHATRPPHDVERPSLEHHAAVYVLQVWQLEADDLFMRAVSELFVNTFSTWWCGSMTSCCLDRFRVESHVFLPEKCMFQPKAWTIPQHLTFLTRQVGAC
jgi:hypothetical protein